MLDYTGPRHVSILPQRDSASARANSGLELADALACMGQDGGGVVIDALCDGRMDGQGRGCVLCRVRTCMASLQRSVSSCTNARTRRRLVYCRLPHHRCRRVVSLGLEVEFLVRVGAKTHTRDKGHPTLHTCNSVCAPRSPGCVCVCVCVCDGWMNTGLGGMHLVQGHDGLVLMLQPGAGRVGVVVTRDSRGRCRPASGRP